MELEQVQPWHGPLLHVVAVDGGQERTLALKGYPGLKEARAFTCALAQQEARECGDETTCMATLRVHTGGSVYKGQGSQGLPDDFQIGRVEVDPEHSRMRIYMPAPQVYAHMMPNAVGQSEIFSFVSGEARRVPGIIPEGEPDCVLEGDLHRWRMPAGMDREWRKSVLKPGVQENRVVQCCAHCGQFRILEPDATGTPSYRYRDQNDASMIWSSRIRMEPRLHIHYSNPAMPRGTSQRLASSALTGLWSSSPVYENLSTEEFGGETAYTGADDAGHRLQHVVMEHTSGGKGVTLQPSDISTGRWDAWVSLGWHPDAPGTQEGQQSSRLSVARAWVHWDTGRVQVERHPDLPRFACVMDGNGVHDVNVFDSHEALVAADIQGYTGAYDLETGRHRASWSGEQTLLDKERNPPNCETVDISEALLMPHRVYGAL